MELILGALRYMTNLQIRNFFQTFSIGISSFASSLLFIIEKGVRTFSDFVWPAETLFYLVCGLLWPCKWIFRLFRSWTCWQTSWGLGLQIYSFFVYSVAWQASLLSLVTWQASNRASWTSLQLVALASVWSTLSFSWTLLRMMSFFLVDVLWWDILLLLPSTSSGWVGMG